MARMNDKNAAAAGYAALSICESLLLAIGEQKILSERDVCGVLEDAAATHRAAVGISSEAVAHRAAANLIEQMLAKRNAALPP